MTNTTKVSYNPIEAAYHRGEQAFIHGDKKLIEPDTNQAIDVKNRLRAHRWDDEKKLNRLTAKLASQGLTLVDLYDSETALHPFDTECYISVEASNPYNNGSLMAKEWQRGFNAAYFANQRKLLNES